MSKLDDTSAIPHEGRFTSDPYKNTLTGKRGWISTKHWRENEL